MEILKSVVRVHIALFFEEIPDALKLALALKETFSTMFPKDPQMIPLPPEAPEDAPRCIFQNEGGSANLTFSLARMDLDNSLKIGSPWRNHVEVIGLTFVAVCKTCDIKIKRLGIATQILMDENLIQESNEKTLIADFKSSDEKNIAWVTHKQISEFLKLNINTNVQINCNNPEAKGVLMLDVNTSIDSDIPRDDVEVLKIMGVLLDQIEEKMQNVF